MRPTLLLVACTLPLVACTAATVQFGDTAGRGSPDSADTAADSGGNGGDGGNGGNGGETGADSGTATSSSYTGEVSGRLSYSDHQDQEQVECSGPTTFSVDGDGTLAGTATCGAGPQSVTGPLAGSVTGASVHATWTVQVGAASFAIPLAGLADGDTIDMHGETSLGNVGSFSANITANR